MADNQAYEIKIIKNKLRDINYHIKYIGKTILDVGGGTAYLEKLLSNDTPFMIGRLGAEESRTAIRWARHIPYSQRNIHNIMYNAGVFPNDKSTIDEFCRVYTEALRNVDGIFTWGCKGEAALIRKYAPRSVTLLDNSVNNILFYDKVWTTALEGKRVLVIHPFIDTIKMQYEKRDKLFTVMKLPTFKSIDYVRTVQSNAGENESVSFESWFKALESMKNEIALKEFDVALIAAGAYGLPLAAYIKSLGKQSIHMASSMQILFGIRGKRWDNWPTWASYFNEFWVYPSEAETPKKKGIVEGGSYWK